jgi:hypothetical protein
MSHLMRVAIWVLQLCIAMLCAAVMTRLFLGTTTEGMVVTMFDLLTIALALGYTGGWCAKQVWTQFFDRACQ